MIFVVLVLRAGFATKLIFASNPILQCLEKIFGCQTEMELCY